MGLRFNLIFKGWVPTATGRLSFTAFGDTDYPTKYRRYGNVNRFCVVQKRSLLDTALPLPFSGRFARVIREYASRAISGLSGDFIFVMLGSVEETTNSADGFLFIVSCRRNREVLERLETKLANLSFGYDIHPYDYENAIGFLDEEASRYARFSLLRSGECLIEIENRSSEQRASRLDNIVANQLFFFLKDCFHKHQHHHPTHDAILPIYPVSDEMDNSWISRTQYRLYRQIIRFKRYKDHKTLYRASGVLAYAQAFEQNFQRTTEIQEFRTIELEKSLSVRRDEIYHFDQLKLNKQQTLVSGFFAVTTFMISAAVLAQLDHSIEIAVSPIIATGVQAMASYPTAAMGVAYVIARLLRMAAFNEFPSDWPIIRGMYQLLRGGSLARFVLVLSAVGGLLTAASSVLIVWALS